MTHSLDSYQLEVKGDVIKSLRDLADWLESTPSAPAPYFLTIYTSLSGKDHAKQLVREAGGIEKKYEGNSFELKKNFGDAVRYVSVVSRDAVCTARVVGTEMKEVPDYKNIPKVTKEVDIVEWDCDPLLAPDTEG